MIGILLHDALWSALAAAGFAVLFNVPIRALPGCVICGASGHALRTLLIQQFGLNIELSTLIGATMVGFMSSAFARRYYLPASIFSITGAIPLVPGVFAYSTMIGIIDIATTDPANVSMTQLVETVVNGIKTGLILIAIAGGITAPTLLFNRHRPVV